MASDSFHARFSVMGHGTLPMAGCFVDLPGVVAGVTLPYLMPWDISPHGAANEPAKPPLTEEQTCP